MSNYQKTQDPLDGIIQFAVIIAVLMLFVYMQRTQMYAFSIWLADKIFTGIYFIQNNLSLDASKTIDKLIYINQKAVFLQPSFSNIYNINAMTGSIFAIPFSLILLLWLAYANIVHRYENMFTTVHDYESLKNEYYKINPRLRVIQHIPNFALDHEKGAFSRIETEWLYAVKHKIINGSLSSINKTRESFNEEAYLSAVYKQCGKLHPHPIVVDNKVQIHGAAKVMLAIMCFYYEHEYEKTKIYLDKSCLWFTGIRHSASNYEYKFIIPKKENKILDQIIIQAFTNSKTLDKHDVIRRKNAKEPLINTQIRKKLFIHHFTTTLLMSLYSNIKMVSTSDFKWLKAIDRHLYYALNNVGDPSPHPRCMGSAFIYEQEKMLFKKRQPLIKKELSTEFQLSTRDVITLFDWDISINDFYFALEQRQWVHHTKYLDVEDEDLINLKEQEFSYDNQIQILLLGKKQSNKYITTEIHFRKKDGSRFIDSMMLNKAGMIDEKDIAKLSIVINSNYLIVNDYAALLKLCKLNQKYLPKIQIRGYDVLADACEVMGIKAYSWHNIINKYKASYDSTIEKQLSKSEFNWYIMSHITDAIKDLYSVSQKA